MTEYLHTPVQAGASKTSTSFQRVIVPLLRAVSLSEIANSPLGHLVNPILATILDSLDFDALRICLKGLVDAGSFADTSYGHVSICRWQHVQEK